MLKSLCLDILNPGPRAKSWLMLHLEGAESWVSLFKDPAGERLFLYGRLGQDTVLSVHYSVNFKVYQYQAPINEIQNNFFCCNSVNKS